MKGKADDDIGFDEHGRPYMLGEEAARKQDAIINHPDARPVLVVAMVNGEIGIRVYGPPSVETADLLDEIAAFYRKSVEASRGRRQ